MIKRILGDLIWKYVRFQLTKNSSKKDPHKYFASLVFNKPEDEVNREERSKGKVIMYKIIYGRK